MSSNTHPQQAAAEGAGLRVDGHQQVLLGVGGDVLQQLQYLAPLPGGVADDQHHLVQAVQILGLGLAHIKLHRFSSL